MSIASDPGLSAGSLPEVPLTVEGSSILHQIVRLRWPQWKSDTPERRSAAIEEATRVLTGMESVDGGWSGLYSLLGHKGDLLFVHFRRSFEELSEAEIRLARTAIWDYLEPVTSYLSVVELGLYESTGKVYGTLAEQGIEPHSPEWNSRIEETLQRQRTAMAPRLYPEKPGAKFICFYPMNRRRGEHRNWYQLPMPERARQMQEHGLVGRRYAGEVKQIISGSIGFDDWEWGVDLFADNPLVFKRLIYEMRFDEVSAVYAEFGSFFVGLRRRTADLPELLKVS